jgi:NitT/TauT family transport system ATP-binding protein
MKTVRGNVQFGLKMKGVPPAERRQIAGRFIDMVKLRGFEDRYPTELSGGMQRRVTLARILAADPEVLLMPFAALDRDDAPGDVGGAAAHSRPEPQDHDLHHAQHR